MLNKRTILLCLLLGAVTLGLYWRATSYGFIRFDDYQYVAENLQVQAGLTWPGVRWAFTTDWCANWHPLTWVSHMLDFQFYGLNPGRFHFTNALLHAINSILVFMVLLRMTGAVWRSFIVAALFAWHPAHVESVAWISERKDVLSTFFGLLAILAYACYAARLAANRRTKLCYCAALLCFLLALLSKPMVVTLPFLLLLLDYWPLNRIDLKKLSDENGIRRHELFCSARSLIIEKTPFFLLSVLCCFATVVAQRGATASVGVVGVGARVENALIAYVRYACKLFWPRHLCIFYPLPQQSSAWMAIGAGVCLVGITWICFRLIKAQPYLFVGWSWFLGTLVPVIGLVQVGSQAMADRYTYIPSIGLFIAVVWGLEALGQSLQIPKQALGVLAGGAVVACCCCTIVQLGYWQSSSRLFQHAFDLYPNPLANVYLGDSLIREGDLKDGLARLEAVSKESPGYHDVEGRIGAALDRQGQVREAIPYYRTALELNSDQIESLNNLAWIRASNKDKELRNGAEAVELAKRACELTKYERPSLVGTLAAAYAEAGQFSNAVAMAIRARDLAVTKDERTLAEKNESLLKLYRAGRAYHEGDEQ